MKKSIEEIKAERWFRYNSSTVTMESWPKIINSTEELPENYKDYFILDKKLFPYSIYIPETYVSKKLKNEKNNSKVVSLFDDKIMIYEDFKSKIQIAKCLFKDIEDMEFGSVLLKAWIRINTADHSYIIVFNAAKKEFFEPLVKKFRLYVNKLKEEKPGSKRGEIARFDFLSKTDFKLMNYGAKSVINGINIKDILYQEKVYLKNIKIFNFVIFEKFVAAHLAVLTEKELLLIKEENDILTNRDIYLGGVYESIPIEKIKKIIFFDSDFPGVAIVGIETVGNKMIQSYYDKKNEGAKKFFNKIMKLSFA